MATITIGVSPLERALSLLMHLLAVMALWLSALNGWLTGLCLLLVVASALWQDYKLRAGYPGRVRGLTLHANFCTLHFAGCEQRTALPQPVFISAWLLVIKLPAYQGQPGRQLSLWSGSLSRGDDWRLRRQLRGYPLPPSSGSD